MIKSVVTGQAPITLELRNTSGKKLGHTQSYARSEYHTASFDEIFQVKSSISQLRCCIFIFIFIIFDASRRGKKLLNSSTDKNEGTYRSGEGREEPAM